MGLKQRCCFFMFFFKNVVQVQLNNLPLTTLPCPMHPHLAPLVLHLLGFAYGFIIHVPWWSLPFFSPLPSSLTHSGDCQFGLYFNVSGYILFACFKWNLINKTNKQAKYNQRHWSIYGEILTVKESKERYEGRAFCEEKSSSWYELEVDLLAKQWIYDSCWSGVNKESRGRCDQKRWPWSEHRWAHRL